jgi:conjugal transfer pilus assembly protein TraK
MQIRLILMLLMLMTTWLNECQATQVIEVQDGALNSVRISGIEPNRLVVKNGRVHKVWGVDGDLVVKADEDSGQIYFYPSEGGHKQSFSIFVKDETGAVYTLVVTPADVPSETIILQRREVMSQSYKKQALGWESGQPYEKTLTELIKKMAMNKLPDGYMVSEVKKEIHLWNEADLSLEYRYSGGSLSGEVYLIKNVDSKKMRMNEREFYRDGVLAVSIAKHELDPGESTHIYLVTGAE